MANTDKFRIDELISAGSKVIKRRDDDSILVKKKDGESTEFTGETSGYVEKPKYNTEELQKALDVKVDELIKGKKPKRGPYVLKSIYDAALEQIEDLRAQLEDYKQRYQEQLAINAQLEAEIESLQTQLDSAELLRASAENQLQVINDRYTSLLADFQNSIIKGTKEAIERVSLEAQVRGLQAQKESLKQQLILKDQIEEAEEEAQATVASLEIQGQPGGYDSTRDSGWKIPDDAIQSADDLANNGAIVFKSFRKSSGWTNGNTMEVYNLTQEPVEWKVVSVKPKSGYSGNPVFALGPTSGTIPARSGETPGKKVLTASKVRNLRGSSFGGRKKWFYDEVELKIGNDTYKIPFGFYRKVKNGGKGN